jgi:hypothetical protein
MGTPYQEDRPLEVVEVEERLALQVIHLGLQGPIGTGELGATRQQLVAELESQLELSHLFNEQLHPVQVSGRELGIGSSGGLELEQGLVDPAFVPQDLTASVVCLGATGVDTQRLVEPGQGLLDPAAMGSLHGLIQAVPVAVFVLHGFFAVGGNPFASRRC